VWLHKLSPARQGLKFLQAAEAAFECNSRTPSGAGCKAKVLSKKPGFFVVYAIASHIFPVAFAQPVLQHVALYIIINLWYYKNNGKGAPIYAQSECEN
jgi:hypothetical protein